MNIRIKERLQLLDMLKAEGNLISMVIQRDIRKKIEPTQELIKKVGLVQEGSNIRWKNEEDQPVEITFTRAELDHLKSCARDLDRGGKISEANLDTIQAILKEEVGE